jgi:hypothetical protein
VHLAAAQQRCLLVNAAICTPAVSLPEWRVMAVTGFPLGLDASKVMEGGPGGSRITDCMRSGTLRAYPVICTSEEAITVACILPSSEGTRLHKEAPAGGRAERSCTHAQQCFSSRLAFLKPVDSFVVSGQSSSASRSAMLSRFTHRGRKRTEQDATENDQPFAQATSAWSGHWLEAS